MQQAIFRTLALLGWITCAISAPDSVISKNDNELRGVSGLRRVLTSLSGYLTTTYYDDTDCKILNSAEGVKLGACRYISLSKKYSMTIVDQNVVNSTLYNDKDCTIVFKVYPSFAYMGRACGSSKTFLVSATRSMPIPGYMKRSVYRICS
jgi:hypothetical protein